LTQVIEISPNGMMRPARARSKIVHMTTTEHLEHNSFAYCDELPPDVAEGLPLTAARRRREVEHAPISRVVRTWVKVVTRKR
jgi:hypothetical protein